MKIEDTYTEHTRWKHGVKQHVIVGDGETMQDAICFMREHIRYFGYQDDLTFDEKEIEQAGDNPDRLATPADEGTSREISTVAESACAGVLKPEIMQSLGIKVALQISTDVTGQVTQASTQVTSRNSAYDELARCLVQHWGFIPAEDEGEPIPSNALRVWVTIDRL